MTAGKQFLFSLVWLLILLASSCQEINAQAESRLRYEIRRVAMRDGMEFQYVTALCMDASGLLWVGTKRGLYSFDGIRLQRFDLKNVSGREIFDPYISNLQVDSFSKSYMFISTPRGVLVMDPEKKQLVSDTCVGLPEGFLREFTLLSKVANLNYWLIKSDSVCQLKLIPENKHYQLQKITSVTKPASITDIIPVNGRPDEAWMLSSDKKIIKINGSSVATFLLEQGDDGTGSTDQDLLYWGNSSGKWLGWDKKLQVYTWDANDPKNVITKVEMQVEDYLPELTYANEFLGFGCELKCFLPLNAGQIALGTNHGLFIIRKRPAGFVTFPELSGSEIRGIHVDEKNNVYVGTYDGLYVKEPSKRFEKYNLVSVWDFLPLRDDYWYLVRETPSPIVPWNPITRNAVLPFPRLPGYNIKNGLSICMDKNGIIWMGNYYGLIRTNFPGSSQFITWEEDKQKSTPMMSFVRVVIPDPIGNGILLGNTTGLFRIIFEQNTKTYTIDPDFPNLDGLPVSDIYPDQYQRLWVATKGKGVACLNLKNLSIPPKWYSEEDGLSNNSACMIRGVNQDSFIWISTHNGLSRLNTFTERFYNFYEDNGLPNSEFNSAAAAKAPDGTLYFGGLAGLVSFHPNQLNIKDYQHDTHIASVRYFNSDTKKINTLNYDYQNGINLPPYQEYLEIQLASSELINPSRIKYRYRLLGLSDLWTYTAGEHELKFIRLSPGSYTFEVQVISFDGHLGKVKQLKIFVNKPYYETWWFRLFLFFLLKVILYLAYRARMRRMIYKQQIGQQIADDLHDDIGNKLNIIHLEAQKLAKMQTDNPSLAAELGKMTDISRNALRSLQNMIWSVDARREGLQSLFDRIQDFADGYLRPLGIKLKVDCPATIPDRNMNLRARHHIMLIYQELLTNMVKYTHSERIEIKIWLDKNTLFINIANHFESKNTQPPETGWILGRGQATIERRLNRIHGNLTWLSNNAQLQELEIEIPEIFKRT